MITAKNQSYGFGAHAMKKTLVFTTLAINQTRFWLALSERLSESGIKLAFISFDDCSSDIIDRKGYPCLRISGVSGGSANIDDHKIFDKFASQNPNLYISHERVVFGVSSSEHLIQKFSNYFTASSKFLSDLKVDGEVYVFQELGGFISVLSALEAARSLGIDNYFVEPSFFKGRQFFIKNSLASKPIIEGKVKSASKNKVKKVLADVLSSKSIVVPDKDRHHYSSAISKIFNLRNLTRFLQKLITQYFFGKHFEFGYPIKHARHHLQMFTNSIRSMGHYTKIDTIGKFIYFPLHVPADAALTLRAPKFLDQLSLVDYIARNIPIGYSLVIKEHPAQIGATNYTRLTEILRRYDYVHLLNPNTNNFDVLGEASCVISINSKTGAEALLLGLPVIVVGDAFYSKNNLVTWLEDIADLNSALKAAVKGEKSYSNSSVLEFFYHVWQNSKSGELYNLDEKNIVEFSNSILDTIDKKNEL